MESTRAIELEGFNSLTCAQMSIELKLNTDAFKINQGAFEKQRYSISVIFDQKKYIFVFGQHKNPKTEIESILGKKYIFL